MAKKATKKRMLPFCHLCLLISFRNNYLPLNEKNGKKAIKNL